jgi:hypothetical protein
MCLKVDDFPRLKTTRAERARPACDVRIQLVRTDNLPFRAFTFLKNVGAGTEVMVVVSPILPQTIEIVEVFGTFQTSPQVRFGVDDERNFGELLCNSHHHVNVEHGAVRVYFNIPINIPSELDGIYELDERNQFLFNFLWVLQESIQVIHEAVTETRAQMLKGCRIATLIARSILGAGDDGRDGKGNDTFTEFDVVFGDGDGFGRGDVKTHNSIFLSSHYREVVVLYLLKESLLTR